MKRLKFIEAASNNDESIVTSLIDEIEDKFDYIISRLEMLEIDGKGNEASNLASQLLTNLDSLHFKIIVLENEDKE